MMLDIDAERQGHKRLEMSNIGFVRSSKNLADGLTKSMQQAAIFDVMSNGWLKIEPEQWIIR